MGKKLSFAMTHTISLALLLFGACAVSASVSIFGHPSASYQGLHSKLTALLSFDPTCNNYSTPVICASNPTCAWSHFGCVNKGNTTNVCVVHSKPVLDDIAPQDLTSCGHVVMLGVAPQEIHLTRTKAPTLVLVGTMDGVTRISNFVVSRTRSAAAHRSFGLIDGASHHSFSDSSSRLVAADDLKQSISHQKTHQITASIIRDFVVGSGASLLQAEHRALDVSAPLTAAMLLEGSSALGHPSCNSDFPTNPTCGYSKWPDHALPPGAANAPSPPLPSDCICGSKWVSDYANPLISGLSESAKPSFTSFAKDAFHDVSDTHPFHLPHIWSTCESSATSCDLNMTTLTMPILKAGDLFPNSSSAPVSAFELRSKMKSRQASWEAAGLGKQDDSKTDKNNNMCKAINQAAYDWALQHADASVRSQFEKNGEPFVIVDDKPATIGITGPEWIKDELVFTRTSAGIEIQSWNFVVGNTNGGHVPWFYPVGMHYCKLLSPARAMEWIYTDGLRKNLAL